MTDREFVEQLARSRYDASTDYWQDLIQRAIDHINEVDGKRLRLYGEHYSDGQPLRIGPDLDEAQEDDWAGWTKPKEVCDACLGDGDKPHTCGKGDLNHA